MKSFSATLAAAPERVYDLISNPKARSRWLRELEVGDDVDRRLEKGDSFGGRSTLLGHRFFGSSTVLDAVPESRLEEEVVIGARLRTRWEVEPRADGGTHVTHTIDVAFPEGPLGALARWVLTRRLAKLQRDGLSRLQKAV